MGDFSNQFDLIPGLPEDVAVECLIRVPISSHNALRLVSHGWNAAVSDPSFYAERRRSGLAERLVCLIQPLSPLSPPPLAVAEEITKEDPAALVVCGGGGPPIYNLNVFNISRQEWRRLSVPVPTFAQCVAVPAAGKVVVLGGWDPVTLEPVKRVVVVDLRTGTWKEGSPMPTARSFFAAAAVEVEGSAAVVYVAGGHDGQKNALRSAEVYDVAADEWRTLPPMSEERDESQGFSFDSTRFWVVSGYGTESQGRFRPDAEIFDPKTQTWSKIEGVWPYSSTTPKSTAASRGGPHRRMQRWWLVGGGEVKEFEWEEKRWKSVKSDPVPNSVTRSSSMSLVDTGEGDGKIFVMGNWENCGDSGEGAFMVEESENEGVTRWKMVQVPCNFMGFSFSASHLIV